MATQTQTITRPGVHESRVHDHVYDPHFIVSGDQDYDVASRRAKDASTRIKHQPVYQTMFSDLTQYPRLRLVPDAVDRLPAFMSEQRIPAQTNIHEDPQVSGTNRFKYFRRPLISIAHSSVPPAILDAESKSLPLWRAGGPRIGESVRDISAYRDRTLSLAAAAGTQRQQLLQLPEGYRPKRTIHTQTDYRESEAQTDPYSPEYVVKPGSHPEVLSIASLSYGRGLPAGLAEVEMIERMREKREWEARLPPLSDVSQHARRRKLMEQQELKEWSQREQEIEKLQEEKMERMIKLLQQREENDLLRTGQHCDKLWSKKQEEKAGKVDKIGHEYRRSLRKLSAKRNNVEGRFQRSNLVDQYGDFGSQAYAPLTRIGVFIDRNSNNYSVQNPLLDSYTDLCEIDRSVPDSLSRPPKAPERRTTTSAGFTRRKYRQEEKLKEIYTAIKKDGMARDERVKPLRFLEKIERPPPRPLTPSVEGPSTDEVELDLAVTLIQAVLRGRGIQNSMFEGVTRRRDLLQELRSTHALHETAQQIVAGQKLETLQKQQQRAEQLLTDAEVSGVLGSVEGEVVGDTLDFLSKELVRLQEERRIHAYSLLAERVRRMREAEESGMRQVEERRRREVDAVFRQVAKVHQTSVDEYLQDVIRCSVGEVATVQAREEMQHVAECVNAEAHQMEQRRTKLESEEIVADLVHSFLLPEAQRQAAKENVRRNQQKFLLAAHDEVYALRDELYAVSPLEKPTENNEFILSDSGPAPAAALEIDSDEDKYISSKIRPYDDEIGSATPKRFSSRGSSARDERGSLARDERASPLAGDERGSPTRAEIETCEKSADVDPTGSDGGDSRLLSEDMEDHTGQSLVGSLRGRSSVEDEISKRSSGASSRAGSVKLSKAGEDCQSSLTNELTPGYDEEEEEEEYEEKYKANEEEDDEKERKEKEKEEEEEEEQQDTMEMSGISERNDSSRVDSRNSTPRVERVGSEGSNRSGRSSATGELRTSSIKSTEARKSASPHQPQ